MAARIQSNCPLAIASDHAGIGLKAVLVELLKKWKVAFVDLGTQDAASVDYPDFAAKLARGIADGNYSIGVLVCGSGIGMSMVANRFPKVRAALCTSAYMAKVARKHNDANVLCLGERVIGSGEAEDILRSFLDNDFEGGRHMQRIAKIDSCADPTGNS